MLESELQDLISGLNPESVSGGSRYLKQTG